MLEQRYVIIAKHTHTIKMYLFLSSRDSQFTHPNNNAWHFTVDLRKYIALTGLWKCALMDIHYDGDKGEPLYVFTDICADNFVQDRRFPVLRLVHGYGTCHAPYYMEVSRDHLTHITVYIKDHNMETPSFMPQNLTCTLHLKSIK